MQGPRGRSGRAPGMQVTDNNPICRPGADGDSIWGSFAIRQCACRSFQKITNSRMAILPDQRDRAIVKHGNDHCTAVMMDHLALISHFTLAHGVDSDVEDASVEDLLAVDDLWQLSRWRSHVVVPDTNSISTDATRR